MFRKNSQKSASGRRTGVLGAVALWILLCFTARGAQSVTLAWNASEASDVAGYFIHYGRSSLNYTDRIDAGTNTQFTVNGLEAGLTYYFAVTAYNSEGIESIPSAEVNYLAPGILALGTSFYQGGPMNLQFPVAQGHWYEIQASVDLKYWINIEQTETAYANSWFTFQDFGSSAFPMRFYRFVDHLSSVLPPPDIQSIVPFGPNITFTWNAEVGQTYQVQYSDNQGQYGFYPGSITWNNLGDVVTATNSTETASFFLNVSVPWYFLAFRVILAATVPPPVIQSATQTNDMITLTWNSVAGEPYQIQSSSSLTPADWINLGGVITASGPVTTASEYVGPNPPPYYRIIIPSSSAVAIPIPTFQPLIQQGYGSVTFTLNTMPGMRYDVQYTANLEQPDWQDWSGAFTAGSTNVTFTDIVGPNARRFYRAVMLP